MPDFGGGPDPESLRSFLRQWAAPPAPPEVEDRLRTAFRRRARSRTPALWLAAAAAVVALALLAGALVLRSPFPKPASTTPPAPPVPIADATPPPAVAARREPQTAVATAATALATAARPAPTAQTAAPRRRPTDGPGPVVVEPRQAELIARFGRSLQALPEVALQDSTARMAPADWQPLTNEWPVVHWSQTHSEVTQ